jgi:hypothetical protein
MIFKKLLPNHPHQDPNLNHTPSSTVLFEILDNNNNTPARGQKPFFIRRDKKLSTVPNES